MNNIASFSYQGRQIIAYQHTTTGCRPVYRQIPLVQISPIQDRQQQRKFVQPLPIQSPKQPPKYPPKQPIKYFDQLPKKGTSKTALIVGGVAATTLVIAAIYYFGFAKNVSLAAQATNSLFTSSPTKLYQKISSNSQGKSIQCPSGFKWNGKSCVRDKHKNRNRNKTEKEKEKEREDQPQQEETKEYQPYQLKNWIHRAYDPERPLRFSPSLRHQPHHHQKVFMHESINM